VSGGLLVEDGLLVGVGLLVGDGLLVADGAADGAVVAELTGAGTVDAGTGTGTGSVARGAELGNSVMTGGAVAALCLATADEGTGVDDGEATAWSCGPSRPRVLSAALCAPAPGKPAELVGPTR
jgi:hypothetical protein